MCLEGQQSLRQNDGDKDSAVGVKEQDWHELHCLDAEVDAVEAMDRNTEGLQLRHLGCQQQFLTF